MNDELIRARQVVEDAVEMVDAVAAVVDRDPHLSAEGKQAKKEPALQGLRAAVEAAAPLLEAARREIVRLQAEAEHTDPVWSLTGLEVNEFSAWVRALEARDLDNGRLVAALESAAGTDPMRLAALTVAQRRLRQVEARARAGEPVEVEEGHAVLGAAVRRLEENFPNPRRVALLERVKGLQAARAALADVLERARGPLGEVEHARRSQAALYRNF